MVDWSTKPWIAYRELAMDHVQLAGIKNGQIPVVKRKEHPRQWREWYAYYQFRGLPGSMQIMRERDEKTVPTLSPIDFDAEFVPPNNLPDVPRENTYQREPLTPEKRERVARLMERFMRRIVEPAAPNRYQKSA